MISWDDNPVFLSIYGTRRRAGHWGVMACIPAVATVLACAAGIVFSRGLLAIRPETVFLGIAVLSLTLTQAAFLVSTRDPLAAACREHTATHLVLSGLSPENWLAGHVLAFVLDCLSVVAMHGPLFGMIVWAGYTSAGLVAWTCILVAVTALNLLLLRLAYWRMEFAHWAALIAWVVLGWTAALMLYGSERAIRPGAFTDLARMWSSLCPVMGLLSLHVDAFLSGAPALAESLSHTLPAGPWRVGAGSAVLCLASNGILCIYLLGCILCGPRRAMLNGRGQGLRSRTSPRHPSRAVIGNADARRLFQDNAAPPCRHFDGDIALVWALGWTCAGLLVVVSAAAAVHRDQALGERGQESLFLWLVACFALAAFAAPAACFRRHPGAGFTRSAIRRHTCRALLTGLGICVLSGVLTGLVVSDRYGWFGGALDAASAVRISVLVMLTAVAAGGIGALMSSMTVSPTAARILAAAMVLLWAVGPIWLGTTRLSYLPTDATARAVAESRAGLILSLSPVWHAGIAVRAEELGPSVGSAFLEYVGISAERYPQYRQTKAFLTLCLFLVIAAALAWRFSAGGDSAPPPKGGEEP